jgi:hypothetical protein
LGAHKWATILGLQGSNLEALISLIRETGLKPQPTDLEWVQEGSMGVIKLMSVRWTPCRILIIRLSYTLFSLRIPADFLLCLWPFCDLVFREMIGGVTWGWSQS